jgi:hypothetical protein
MIRWKSFGGKRTSLKAQVFIRDRISQLMREGYPQKQAIAIAYREARKKGFKIKHYEPTEHEKEYYYKYGGS